MNVRPILFGLLAVVASIAAPLADVAAQTATPAPKKVLIVYDYQPNQPFGKLGKIYAIMQRNLLGHFGAQVDMVPVDNYVAGQVEAHDATFYMGAYYDNPLVPATFINDVYNTQKTVVWYKDNLWKLAWDGTKDFAGKYGFAFDTLRGMNAAPSPANPAPGFFDTVTYKGKAMTKFYRYDAAANVVQADPDIGLTHVVDAAKAQALVNITNTATGEVAPYVMRSGNFWYVADMPFTYIGPRDRYLALCDLLYDMLGVTAPATKQAMVRLEDVSATVNLNAMKQLADFMKSKKVPFSVATVPFYRDPLGHYNFGAAEEIHFNDAGAKNLRDSLDHAMARGGSVVLHGYTHQYSNQLNPWTGVTADDFEFWNIVANTPVAEDSTSWALARVNAGLAELGTKYAPFAFEVPHYEASPVAARAIASKFRNAYQRAVYFTSDAGRLDNGEYAAGQFFPYVIESDYYGQRILPENLGNVEYDISATDPSSNVVYTADDILLNADYAQVVRGGFASFFFHPFWLEPDLKLPGLADFKKIINGITGMGYTWINADQL